jgi:SPOR domain
MSEGAEVDPAAPAGGGRVCLGCGHSPAESASFCRNCGARYEKPPVRQSAAARPAPPPVAPTGSGNPVAVRQPSGPLLFLAVAIMLTVAGIAAALLLSGGGASSTTTVLTSGGGSSRSGGNSPTGGSSPASSIEAGRYVQAGSFKFVADAEKERRRLAEAGIDVEVVPSEEAQELYPGFQVLLGGPLHTGSAERSLLEKLHRDGVPSAFARPLTPARAEPPYGKLAPGTWKGKLEESSTSRPRLDRTLPVTFVTSAGGREGTLIFSDIECVAALKAEPSAGPSLRFGRSSGCFAGSWRVRPSQGGLMLTLLPSGSDLIVLGELHPT